MSDMPTKYGTQLQPTQERRYSGIDKAELIKGYGCYQYYIPAEDQIIAYLDGMRISGTYKKRGDSQSDYTTAPQLTTSKDIKAILNRAMQQYEKMVLNLHWELEYSPDVEEPIDFVAVHEQIGGQPVDETADDLSHWTADQLASAILDPKSESDMPHLREMILIAEDTGFTVAQSEQLAPWLLSFAQRYRDSSDPQDEAVVWSAIRTGASMLRPDDADRLVPLLEPGHSIETSLVTVKMLGRIFEAQPPEEVDEHQDLAVEVYPAAEIVRNRYAITSSRSAAIAQLAIYALAAMASSEVYRIVEYIRSLDVAWFTKQTLRELRELQSIWSSRPVPVADQPRKLLDRIIQTLDVSDSSASGGSDAGY